MFNTGCKTVVSTNPTSGATITNQVVNSAAIIPVINAVVPLAVQVAVQKETNSIVYFQATTVVLDTLVTGGTYDPANVTAALSSLQVNTPEAQMAVQAGLSIYKSFAAEAVTQKLTATESLAVLQAFSDAIKQGLMFTRSSSGTTIEVQVK